MKQKSQSNKMLFFAKDTRNNRVILIDEMSAHKLIYRQPVETNHFQKVYWEWLCAIPEYLWQEYYVFDERTEYKKLFFKYYNENENSQEVKTIKRDLEIAKLEKNEEQERLLTLKLEKAQEADEEIWDIGIHRKGVDQGVEVDIPIFCKGEVFNADLLEKKNKKCFVAIENASADLEIIRDQEIKQAGQKIITEHPEIREYRPRDMDNVQFNGVNNIQGQFNANTTAGFDFDEKIRNNPAYSRGQGE